MVDDLTRSILEQRDNIENQRNKEINSNREYYIKKLENKIQQYKEVIEEVRERIERNLSFCENDSQNAYEVCAVRIANDKKLLQILDKVNGVI